MGEPKTAAERLRACYRAATDGESPYHDRADHSFRADAFEADVKAVVAEHADLLAACRQAMLACQDNLKMYQYKNEPVLHAAFVACKAAVARAEGGA